MSNTVEVSKKTSEARVLYYICKAQEGQPDEFMLMYAIDDNRYVKDYIDKKFIGADGKVSLPEVSIRREKKVDATKIYDTKYFANVTAYFDYLLSNRNWKQAQVLERKDGIERLIKLSA